MPKPVGALLVAGAIFCSLSLALAGEPLRYQKPPEPIASIVARPPTPYVGIGPDNQHMLILEPPALPPISFLAEPELRLAGLRIKPRTNGPSRDYNMTGLRVVHIATRAERKVTVLPTGAEIGFPDWSPDGKHFAFTLTEDQGISLWVADVKTARARRLTGPRLNTAAGFEFEWLSDSRTLLVQLVPDDRGEPPVAPGVPTGPMVQESAGRKAPARTFQDLLKNPHDERLFEHYFTAQLAMVSLDGKVGPLGPAGIFGTVAASPDGRYVLVKLIVKPYSYSVPMRRFARRYEVWDRTGKLVKHLADLPPAEEVPIAYGSVPEGPRSFSWRNDSPATLVWVEAQDGGDARRETSVRDRVFMLPAPFKRKPVALADLALRYGGVAWGTDELALVSTWWWKNRRTRTWIVRPGAPRVKPRLLWDRTWEDRYNDPGWPVTRPTPRGTRVLMTLDRGRTLLLRGRGASPEGDRPFLDRLDLGTRKTQRLWRSQAPHLEFVSRVLDGKGDRLITRRESKEEPPNFFIRDLAKDTLEPVTRFPHPTPELKGLHKEVIRYDREDGVTLTATLYLPPGYQKDKDGPLPMVMWAYPMEYKSAAAAGQMKRSPHRFVRVGWWSPVLWLIRGYAVLDDPTMPIVGEGDAEPNDTYVEQLIASARAAADEVTRRGVADRSRLAIGGHSYGAFMAANLLAHSDLFRAGIARSGAFNRTLTPFSFQAEERTLWEARDTYIRMSPFMHADKIDEPLLLIHGEADNNSGTFPIQSQRLFEALRGLGGTVRLVMLPHESHGYRAHESILHMLWETGAWLDRHVKPAGSKEAP